MKGEILTENLSLKKDLKIQKGYLKAKIEEEQTMILKNTQKALD